jgi:hypothetical protein
MTKADKVWLCRLARMIVGSIVWALGSAQDFRRWESDGDDKLWDRLTQLMEE